MGLLYGEIMIERKIQEVFYAPTANRTFITKRGAANAEAKAKIRKKYPTEPFEDDTGAGFHWTVDLKNADKILKRLSNLIFKAI